MSDTNHKAFKEMERRIKENKLKKETTKPTTKPTSKGNTGNKSIPAVVCIL